MMRHDRKAHIHTENGSTILTRRSVLERAGSIIAAMAFPRWLPSAGAGQPGSVMAELSTYMSEARSRTLPDEVIEKVKHHILDTLAAMVSGSELPPGRAAVRFARTYGGEKVATVVASEVLCGPIEAALANGVLAHSDETDDSHARSGGHPGCAIIPAALALGEQFGIDGTRFLRAVVLGYDVGTRVTMTLGAEAFKIEAHKSDPSVVGIFGAAAAAGCAASLNAQQMRWLLDYSAQQSSGIAAWQRDTEHMEKAFVFGGMPARSGVTAATLVQSGWTGVDDILSGPDNFFVAYAPQSDPAGLIEKLGERYEVTRTNIKKWTVGSPIQAPLDALEILLKRHPFEAEQVQQVTVRVATHMAATVNNRDMPDICLQHMIAVMLIDKTASFHSAHDRARMQDPAIVRQRAKVQLIPDDQLQKRLPSREATVEVTLIDGTHLNEHVEAVRGTAENPMTRNEIVAKCRDLITPVLGTAACTNIIDTVLGLERAKDIRELRPMLQRA
jgi:2-methylcitrate dehydratase PrpD